MSAAGFAESEHFGMNTAMTHRAFGRQAEKALQAVRKEATRLEGLLSRFKPGSDIGRLNRSAGIRSEKMGEEAFEVLSRAVEFSRHSSGLFDVTIAPLITLWSKGRDTGEPPDCAGIRQILPLVDHTGLTLDPGKRTAALRTPGQAVDLGGIGKGYAADRFLEVFRKYGISSAFTNIGGNVATLGAKPDGSPWRVGIRHPRREEGLIGLVTVSDKSVVTSGDYQRYYMDRRGKRRHHILDPATGYPAESGLASVTIMAESSMDADALSTMVFVAGMERGIGLLEQFPGAEAIIVDEDIRVYMTAGLMECFQAAEGIQTEILK